MTTAARFVWRCWLVATVSSALDAVWAARETIALAALAGGLLVAAVGYLLWVRPAIQSPSRPATHRAL